MPRVAAPSPGHAAETNQRLAPRLFRRHAVAHIFFHREFEMLGYLRIQFRVPLLAFKERAHPLQSFPKGAHHSSPSAGMVNTRPITRDNLCQCAASSASCLRPLRVIE